MAFDIERVEERASDIVTSACQDDNSQNLRSNTAGHAYYPLARAALQLGEMFVVAMYEIADALRYKRESR